MISKPFLVLWVLCPPPIQKRSSIHVITVLSSTHCSFLILQLLPCGMAVGGGWGVDLTCCISSLALPTSSTSLYLITYWLTIPEGPTGISDSTCSEPNSSPSLPSPINLLWLEATNPSPDHVNQMPESHSRSSFFLLPLCCRSSSPQIYCLDNFSSLLACLGQPYPLQRHAYLVIRQCF